MLSTSSCSVANQTISINGVTGNQNGGSKSSSNVGAIVGGVVGGLAVVGIVVAIFVILRKRRRQQRYDAAEKPELIEQESHHPTLAPYYHNSSPTSDYMPVPAAPHSDTTAGFAGVGAGDIPIGLGAHQGPGASLPYGSSTTMTYGSDNYGIGAPGTPAGETSKAREAALNRTHHYAPSLATSSNVGGSQAGSASSRDPLSPGAGSISSTDVMGLRAEVENLRRVMQEIRAERLEPPPEYVEG